MKKKMLVVVLVLIMLVGMVGCSTEAEKRFAEQEKKKEQAASKAMDSLIQKNIVILDEYKILELDIKKNINDINNNIKSTGKVTDEILYDIGKNTAVLTNFIVKIINEKNTDLYDGMNEAYSFDGIITDKEQEMLDTIESKHLENVEHVLDMQNNITEIYKNALTENKPLTEEDFQKTDTKIEELYTFLDNMLLTSAE